MAGIYVHIPFCRQACHYCDFHFSTSKHGVAPLLKAIGHELKLQRHYLEGQQIRTLYFGGGTPSIVPAGEIARIIDQVRTQFPMAPDAEITLEANPDDIQASLVREWMGAGINRLSIGIQSFADSDLQWLNRAHHAGQAEGSVKTSQDTGIENITIDLIYGIPVSADGQWQRNVQQAIELQVPHISAYCLTIEEKTVFGHRYRKGELSPLPDTTSASQFLYLVNTLETSGIHLYEVSNFSKPGFESKHNSAYWTGDHYLGIGPS
ncbi:MAG: radical SAM family heme chaperone HemW, partial [Flavobacteriales bacterium]|nr:radical SAM family heme chaperone HemW [Flavobacteriales bacterium]